MEALGLRPHLVCLNLQHDAVAERAQDDALGAVLWRVRACINWARAHDLPIIHVHTCVSYAPSPPLSGFEVLPNEIVVAKASFSAFAADEWARSVAAGCERALLMGLSRHCDLAATALDGAARGVQIVLVRDAIGLECVDPRASPEALSALLAPAMPSITATELTERRGLMIAY